MPAFKLDENLPIDAADVFRDAGYDASTVHEQRMNGEADGRLADACRAEGRVIVTIDLDFADIRVYPPADYPGIIVLRLAAQDKPHVLDVLRAAVAKIGDEPIDNCLWIVDEERIRIRQ